MRRTLGIATATLGLAALTFAAVPATAATLPTTDAIYILPCDYDELDGILYRVDPATGVATRVGNWTNPDDTVYTCAGPGAYNPVDGKGYWIAWEGPEAYLIQVDLTTGVNVNIGQFTLSGIDYYTPISLAIDDEGNAWGTSYDGAADRLFSVDLTNAALTVVGPTGVTPITSTYGLAYDKVTDKVYGYNSSGDDFYTVDTATGAFTPLINDVLQPTSPLAMAFDSAGNVWGINFEIISAPLSNLLDTQVLEVINPYPADLDDSGETIYSESIIIAPAPVPALAATGADNSASTLVAGAGVLLVIGGIVIARRRAPAV